MLPFVTSQRGCCGAGMVEEAEEVEGDTEPTGGNVRGGTLKAGTSVGSHQQMCFSCKLKAVTPADNQRASCSPSELSSKLRHYTTEGGFTSSLGAPAHSYVTLPLSGATQRLQMGQMALECPVRPASPHFQSGCRHHVLSRVNRLTGLMNPHRSKLHRAIMFCVAIQKTATTFRVKITSLRLFIFILCASTMLI